MRAKKNIGT
uniref:Uncharacterized protein n=1 Tax=Anguilla anguilla TaxID=7936 RepID=A0A0E9V0Z6_ANGAN